MKLYTPDNKPITTWQEWTRPKKEYQWKDGRSAMELAKSWFRSGSLAPPDELCTLLYSHPRFTGIELLSGTPELVTSLPERGEGRNHDLHLIGKTVTEHVTVCIEGKADEPFGNETVQKYWNRSIVRRNEGISTRVPERIEALLSMVDPGTTVQESKWRDVRYQLLTAVCGTIIQALIDESDIALLVVHEFKSDETSADKHRQNNTDYEKFLTTLFDESIELGTSLHGPLKNNEKDIFVGKIETYF